MIAEGLIAGFTLGAAGSLHCAGMCGPLSLALPVFHLSKTRAFMSILLYHFGRVITYSVLGLVFGLAGRSLYIAGFQQWFSLVMGILVLVLAALYFLQKKSLHLRLLNRFYAAIQRRIQRLLYSPTPGAAGFVAIGMANGLLPCGMVYIALASVLSFPSVAESVGFMAMFGAGTLPLMMLISVGGRLIRPEIRMSMQKIVPVSITLVGVLLILRGLNLGIPFISPELPGTPGQAVSCHS